MKILVNGYTVTEHLKLKLNTERNVKEMLDIDKFIGNLKKNKKSYIRLMIILALSIPATTLQVFAAGEITGMALELYKILKEVGYAICLLGATTEGFKCVVSGTIDQLGKVAVKYIAFALMVKFLPKAVDMIFSLGGV